jgi:excinuclease ABC subunit C
MTKKSNHNDNKLPEALNDKLKNLPKQPGIYKFKNTKSKIIYVGKAINLHNRVRSYFQKRGPVDAKTKAMLSKITDVEIIVTDSEAKALILEDTLIKRLKPRYNILLRDDKTYPYIKITNEYYPRILITRRIVRDGSKYIGPFTEVGKIRNLMKLVRTLFYIRSCDFNITAETIKSEKYKICLDYHINKCQAPCVGLVDKQEYNEGIKAAIQVINGKTDELVRKFDKEMKRYSEQMEFEKAAQFRNKLILLRNYNKSQKIVTPDLIDRDVLGLARIDDSACTLLLKIRDGKLIGNRHFIISNTLEHSDEQIIQSTLEKWYMENDFVPKEIFLPNAPAEQEFITDLLSRKRGKSLKIIIPKLGGKKELVNIASINAEYILREYHLALSKKEQTASRAVLSLQRDLRLSKPPLRIECFDNSHIQGSDYVSSMVVFIDGKPKKAYYRKYKIQTVEQNDDFAAMREVIRRRYSKIDENKDKLPDLIIIDGGKGQLSSAVQVLQELNINDKVKVIGLAKRLEEVFIPNEKEPILLPRVSSSLRLIQHLRDEAHRFAITYHRELRKKRTLHTELTNIEGVGIKTAKKLLVRFGSLKKIKQLVLDQLKEELNDKIATNVYNYFHGKNNGQTK